MDLTLQNINLKKYLEAEFYFNYDEPFAPVKTANINGITEITVFEIVDKEMFDFEWVKYIYEKKERIYKRKNAARQAYIRAKTAAGLRSGQPGCRTSQLSCTLLGKSGGKHGV